MIMIMHKIHYQYRNSHAYFGKKIKNWLLNYQELTAVFVKRCKITWRVFAESVTYSQYNYIIEIASSHHPMYIFQHHINNGSFEVFRQYIHEEGHVTVMCLASNN